MNLSAADITNIAFMQTHLSSITDNFFEDVGSFTCTANFDTDGDMLVKSDSCADTRKDTVSVGLSVYCICNSNA